MVSWWSKTTKSQALYLIGYIVVAFSSGIQFEYPRICSETANKSGSLTRSQLSAPTLHGGGVGAWYKNWGVYSTAVLLGGLKILPLVIEDACGTLSSPEAGVPIWSTWRAPEFCSSCFSLGKRLFVVASLIVSSFQSSHKKPCSATTDDHRLALTRAQVCAQTPTVSDILSYPILSFESKQKKSDDINLRQSQKIIK